jgi:hypothetical protein
MTAAAVTTVFVLWGRRYDFARDYDDAALLRVTDKDQLLSFFVETCLSPSRRMLCVVVAAAHAPQPEEAVAHGGDDVVPLPLHVLDETADVRAFRCSSSLFSRTI